ncbi:MAG: hypothetical protein IKK91_11375 [Ruminococcus sp.]|nr:hypothetical protein [Ruminococcus sp.]
MIKKLLILICAGMISLTGCEASGLVHDKHYLRAVAISGGTETQLTLEFFTGDEKVTVTGKDISTAIKNAEILTGKDIFTGYTELAVLGNCDYRETLELLLNDWKVSPSCVITHSSEGGTILSERGTEILAGSVKRAQKQGKTPDCDIITVLGDLLDEKSTVEIAELDVSGRVGRYVVPVFTEKTK